jgi:hypothetical protein
MKLYISHLYEKSTTEKGKGGQKRKFTEFENEEQEGIESKNSMVSWSNGLKSIFDQTSLSPWMNAGRYISLEQVRIIIFPVFDWKMMLLTEEKRGII